MEMRARGEKEENQKRDGQEENHKRGRKEDRLKDKRRDGSDWKFEPKGELLPANAPQFKTRI